jgi:uncharacterized protein (TIGR03086 family)
MDEVTLLGRAIDQAGDMLEHVHSEVVGRPTPCERWSVGDVADHLVQSPRTFLALMRGEQPDWGAPPPHLDDGWAQEFRNAGDDLIHAWHQEEDEGRGSAAWQCAELAVHTWDLARGLGVPTDGLDPAVAEAGLAFMQANLTDENRDGAFGPAQEAPDGAGPYDRIAAFAGRRV